MKTMKWMLWVWVVLLMLLAQGAWGQAGVTPNNPFGSRVKLIRTGAAFAEYTNTIARAAAGDEIRVAKNTWYIGTNTTSWMKSNLTIDFAAGTILHCGHGADSTVRKWFSDEAGVVTNFHVTGGARFLYTNSNATALSAFLVMTNPGSDITFECLEMDRGLGVGPTVYAQSGNLFFRPRRWLKCYEYDAFWAAPHGTGLRVLCEYGRIRGADSAIELAGGAAGGAILPGNFVFRGGVIDNELDVAGFGTSVLDLRYNCVIQASEIRMPYGGYINLEASATNLVTIHAEKITAQLSDNGLIPESNAPIEVKGPARIIGALINSMTNRAAINVEAAGMLWLDGVRIQSDPAAVYSIESPTGVSNTIYLSGVSFDKPIDPRLRTAGSWTTTNVLAVALTADNQEVGTAGAGTITLSSDNATAGNRTFRLVRGARKQIIKLVWSGTNAGELVDDSAVGGAAGNHRLSATWTPTQYDHLILEFNGTDWEESGRSTN